MNWHLFQFCLASEFLSVEIPFVNAVIVSKTPTGLLGIGTF